MREREGVGQIGRVQPYRKREREAGESSPARRLAAPLHNDKGKG